MAAPVPPNARAAKVVETIYSLFFARGSWPSFTELDRYLDMHGEPDAEAVLVGLPIGIAYGVGMPPFRDDQEIALTVAGLAACPNAVEDLEIFLRVVRHAADLEQEQLPGEPKPELTSASILDRIELPAAGRSDLVRRVGALLRVEQWGWAGAAQTEEGWSFTIDRRVRRLRGVATIADYWARTRDEVTATVAPATPQADQALRVRSWLELHRTIPKLVIVNASEAEIRNVVPSMSLQAVNDDGEPAAMVGGGPVGRVAEISPGAAFVGELMHLKSWSKSTQVESTLHLEFDDTRGQRWQLAHGSVIAIEKQERGPVGAATGELVDAQTLDLSEPISGFVTSDSGRVAFISYVHEDRAPVDALQRALEGAGITVWRDLDQLLPGESKRQKIVDAIRHQSFAFLSCFSAARADRERTYANEELSIALDVVRTQSSAAWFIPVRLDDSPMPSLALGLHGTLEDIIWVNLFGDERDGELIGLIAALQRLV